MTGSRNQALLFMVLGFAVWAAAFSILYGVQGAGCELGWHRKPIGPLSLLRILLIFICLLHLSILAWQQSGLAQRCWCHRYVKN
jgi:hypothetical protein